jgi:hypothetical protein
LKGDEWIEILDMATTLSLPFRHELIAETVPRRTRSLPGGYMKEVPPYADGERQARLLFFLLIASRKKLSY